MVNSNTWKWIAGVAVTVALATLSAIANMTWNNVKLLNATQKNHNNRITCVEKDIEYIRQTVTEIKKAVVRY